MGGFGGGRDLAVVAGERRRGITQPVRRRPRRTPGAPPMGRVSFTASAPVLFAPLLSSGSNLLCGFPRVPWRSSPLRFVFLLTFYLCLQVLASFCSSGLQCFARRCLLSVPPALIRCVLGSRSVLLLPFPPISC